MRVEVWRTAMRDEARAAQMGALQSQARQAEASREQAALGHAEAVARLQALMAGDMSALNEEMEEREQRHMRELEELRARLEEAVRAVEKRTAEQEALQAQHGAAMEEVRARHEEAMEAKAARIRQLSTAAAQSHLRLVLNRMALARLAKGEVGMRVEVWRSGVQLDAQAAQLGGLQREPEAGAVLMREALALGSVRALRGAALRRIIQGQAAMAMRELERGLGVWRTSVAGETREGQMGALRHELEAQQVGALKGVALRQLRSVVGRMAMAEARVRVEVWRTAARADALWRLRQGHAAELERVRAASRETLASMAAEHAAGQGARDSESERGVYAGWRYMEALERLAMKRTHARALREPLDTLRRRSAQRRHEHRMSKLAIQKANKARLLMGLTKWLATATERGAECVLLQRVLTRVIHSKLAAGLSTWWSHSCLLAVQSSLIRRTQLWLGYRGLCKVIARWQATHDHNPNPNPNPHPRSPNCKMQV